MSNFLSTTAFRLALVYLLLFCGSVLLLFAIIYTSTVTLAERQMAAIIAAEIRGLAEQYQTRGRSRLAEVVSERSSDEGDGIYLLMDGRGRLMAGNLDAWPEGADVNSLWSELTLLRRDGEVLAPHTVRARAFALPGRLRLLVGRDVQDTIDFEARIVQTFAWCLLLIVGLGLLGGWLFARRLLNRVDRIASHSAAIMGGDLSGRLALNGSGDEFDRLCTGLNRVLERNEQLMTGMRLATDAMAHDLKGPITRLTARIEMAMRDSTPQAGAALAEIQAEAVRAMALFEGLLRIAEAESGVSRTDFAPLCLARDMRALIDLYEPVAQDRDIRLMIDLPERLPIEGHAALISQAMANLLDNALKYTPKGGTITLRGRAIPNEESERGEADFAGVELIIADTGPGIAAGDRERVLRRFERLDQARSSPGSGLGLSLVDAVARLHDARLGLGDASPGLAVTLRFQG